MCLISHSATYARCANARGCWIMPLSSFSVGNVRIPEVFRISGDMCTVRRQCGCADAAFCTRSCGICGSDTIWRRGGAGGISCIVSTGPLTGVGYMKRRRYIAKVTNVSIRRRGNMISTLPRVIFFPLMIMYLKYVSKKTPALSCEKTAEENEKKKYDRYADRGERTVCYVLMPWKAHRRINGVEAGRSCAWSIFIQVKGHIDETSRLATTIVYDGLQCSSVFTAQLYERWPGGLLLVVCSSCA